MYKITAHRSAILSLFLMYKDGARFLYLEIQFGSFLRKLRNKKTHIFFVQLQKQLIYLRIKNCPYSLFILSVYIPICTFLAYGIDFPPGVQCSHMNRYSNSLSRPNTHLFDIKLHIARGIRTSISQTPTTGLSGSNKYYRIVYIYTNIQQHSA